MSKEIVRQQLQDANRAYEDMNVKFMMMFGHQMKDWKGTEEEILAYMDEMKTKG